MKKTISVCLIALALGCVNTALLAQGTLFQDLGFESANLSTIPAGQYGGFVPITSAMPGWSAYLGDIQQTQVLQNNITLGSSAVIILGPYFSQISRIEGNYSALLTAGPVNASISQTGLIPDWALSLTFNAQEISGPGTFSVALNGQNLSLVELDGGNYVADISAWAGQTADLQFTAYSGGYLNNLELDSMEFSTTAAVPEPETCALFLFGSCGFWVYRRFFRASLSAPVA